MRKAQKKQAEDFIRLLGQAHKEIKKAAERGNQPLAMELLGQCQEGAMKLGELIEGTQKGRAAAVPMLEDYCELAYELYEEIAQGSEGHGSRIFRELQKKLSCIENSVKNDIKIRMEAVFLPYKASMWDSMESVWKAADADPDFDVYVMPIPYYDRNQDKSFGARHYEGNDFPDYVPITECGEYNLARRKPDVIYIHNPYDDGNYVTSVDPRFYSWVLKNYTDCLIYLPYYVTAGGMSEVQSLCLSYFYVDYIAVQSEKLIDQFDARIPREKFLPLGSPKLDRTIRLCGNPPKAPEAWEEKLQGKKVYFYNTSLGGMLGNTEAFLKKMRYVFECFKDRSDACLLWRPHPLLESTFASMRSRYYREFKRLKEYFINGDLGIYDDTPDITRTIALCDAYIGDAGTSVTALFGIAGKPLFILNNGISHSPGEDDWRGEIVKSPGADKNTDWTITQGNKLFHSPENDFKYEYYCDLPGYSGGHEYDRAMNINGSLYVCPVNAFDILVIGDHKVERHIQLEKRGRRAGAFAFRWNIGDYLFLIPMHYPAIVRYDTIRHKVKYIEGYNDIFIKNTDGSWRMGGGCIWKEHLLLASPTDSHILDLDSKTGKGKILEVNTEDWGGCLAMVPDRETIWLLPYCGKTIICWEPETGSVREYSGLPDGFKCISRPQGHECQDRPFSWAAFYKDQVFLSPYWGNMFLILHKDTGHMEEWKPPFEILDHEKNGYYGFQPMGALLYRTDTLGTWTYRFFSNPDRRLYDVNLETGQYQEIVIAFDKKELLEQEPGFDEISEWLPYACMENAFYSLGQFLDGNGAGKPFDKQKQIRAYEQIAVNSDGTSGEKIHHFVRKTCYKI